MMSVVFIALLGMANSLIWPSVWPLAIEGLGRFTRIGSSLLIMGNLGGALVPLLYGRLADIVNPQHGLYGSNSLLLFYSVLCNGRT